MITEIIRGARGSNLLPPLLLGRLTIDPKKVIHLLLWRAENKTNALSRHHAIVPVFFFHLCGVCVLLSSSPCFPLSTMFRASCNNERESKIVLIHFIYPHDSSTTTIPTDFILLISNGSSATTTFYIHDTNTGISQMVSFCIVNYLGSFFLPCSRTSHFTCSSIRWILLRFIVSTADNNIQQQ